MLYFVSLVWVTMMVHKVIPCCAHNFVVENIKSCNKYPLAFEGQKVPVDFATNCKIKKTILYDHIKITFYYTFLKWDTFKFYLTFYRRV